MNFEDYVPVVGRIESISEIEDCCRSRMLPPRYAAQIILVLG